MVTAKKSPVVSLDSVSPAYGQRLFKDLVVFWSSVVSVVFIIITVGLILFKFKPTAEPAVLHYNVLTGVDWVGKPRDLYILPALALIIWLYNMFLGKKYSRFEPFALQVLAITSAIFSLLILVAVSVLIRFQ